MKKIIISHLHTCMWLVLPLLLFSCKKKYACTCSHFLTYQNYPAVSPQVKNVSLVNVKGPEFRAKKKCGSLSKSKDFSWGEAIETICELK